MSVIQQLLTDHIDIWTAAETEKKSGRGRGAGNATSVYGINKLRELILDLAVRGKLVPQDKYDEPASDLLKQIQTEKTKLIIERKIKKEKAIAPLVDEDLPFALPQGWNWVRLGEITNFGTTVKLDYIDDDAWVLDLEDIEKDTSKLIQKIRFSERNSLSDKNSFRKGDVLYGKLRPYLNKVIVADEDGVCTTEILPLRCYGKFNGNYFKTALKSPYFLKYVNARSYGMKMPRLGTEDGRQAPFPLPPLAEQHRIVAKVDELMALCDQLEAQHSDAADAHEQLVSNLLGTLTQSQCAGDCNTTWQRIAAHFDTLFTTEASIDALKRTVLQLAVMGKLVAQDSRDESGLELSRRIQRSRIAKRKIVTLSEEIDPLREDFLPNSWSWTSIDQISADDPSAITDGPFGENLKTEHYVDQSGYRVIRLQNIGHGEFRNEYLSYIDEARFEKLVKHQVRGGDLIVAGLIDTSIRCCAAPDDIGHAIVKADCYRLSVHPFVFSSYVLHYLNSVTAHEFAAVHHHGLTLTRIGLGNFRSIPIPLPPFAEQHRIVAKVDELMALCDQVRSCITAVSQQQRKLADVLVEHAVIGQMAL